MQDNSFDKNTLLQRLSIIEVNFGKIVESRKFYINFMLGKVIKVKTFNPVTWWFPKEIKLTEDLIHRIANEHGYLCGCVKYWEREYHQVKNKIDYLASSINRDVTLSIVEFNEINIKINESVNNLDMSKEEIKFCEFLSTPLWVSSVNVLRSN